VAKTKSAWFATGRTIKNQLCCTVRPVIINEVCISVIVATNTTLWKTTRKWKKLRFHCHKKHALLLSCQWRTQKIFMGRGSFSCAWCHLYLVCVFCDVIIWRHIDVFQTNVLAKFALISHSRKNTVFGKKSFLSKQSDTKILQSIYFAYDVGIISSYSNIIADKIKTIVLDKVNYRGTQS